MAKYCAVPNSQCPEPFVAHYGHAVAPKTDDTKVELEISRIIFSNYDLPLPGMCQHLATVTSCEVKQ